MGHAVRYPFNSVPKPGTSLSRAQKIRVRIEVFVRQGICWTWGGGIGKQKATQQVRPSWHAAQKAK